MSDRRAKIIETVKKLIAHEQSARSIDSIEEANAFAARVTALMREYRLERHEVEPSVIDAMDFTEYGMTHVTTYTAACGEQAPWQAFVFDVICSAHACQVVVISELRTFFVAGQNVDRAVACALSAAIVNSIEYLGELKWREAQSLDAAVLMGFVGESDYKESYRIGFVQALQRRLKEEEAAETEALVLIGKALVKVGRFVEKVAGTPSGTVDVQVAVQHMGAAEAGYSDGMRADLETNRVGGDAAPVRKEIG